MTTAKLLREAFSSEECAVREPGAADTVDGACPSIVALPSTETVVAELVRLAATEKWKILPAGNRRHMHTGNVPSRIDVLLSTARLDRILHYEAADLTASAGAGVTLGQLAERTGPQRQFLPVDPPHFEQATLGGTISANLFGHLRTGYGTIRDYVVGARFVRGDGTAVKSGGRVVKNVTGFDLHKLLIGAHGTLGVVTEVSLKLRPMPESELTVLSCVDEEGLRTLMRELNRSALLPIRAAALNREAARAVLPEFTAGGYAVMVTFGDSAAGNRYQAEKLRALCMASRAAATDVLTGEITGAAWLRLRELEPTIMPALTLRVSVLPSRTCDVLAWLTRKLGELCARPVVVAMPLAGVIRVSVHETGFEKWPALISDLRAMVCAGPGSVIVERAPEDLKRAIDVWGEDKETASLVRRIREAFDPRGVFCHG